VIANISPKDGVWSKYPMRLYFLICNRLGRDKQVSCKKLHRLARCRGLMPVILTSQEAYKEDLNSRKPEQISLLRWVSQKYPSQKRAGGVAQGVGPEFKSQYWEKKSIRLYILATHKMYQLRLLQILCWRDQR
jgi:hypothetical protein